MLPATPTASTARAHGPDWCRNTQAPRLLERSGRVALNNNVTRHPANTLSVVMATYNGAAYLGQQLTSILRQTRPPDELVVGDDGSEDNTIDILLRFARKAPFPVSVLHHGRSGYAHNFLLTLEASHGDLIAFSDQDDIWLPNKLERSEHLLQSYGAALVTHGATTVDETLRPMRTGHRQTRHIIFYERFKPNVWPYAWPGHHGNSMLFRRHLLKDCDWRLRPTTVKGLQLAHDELVPILAAIRGTSLYLPDRLVLYRQHPRNVYGARPSLLKRWSLFPNEDEALLDSIERSIQCLQDWAEYFLPLVEPEHRAAAKTYFSNAAMALATRRERLRLPAQRALASVIAAAIQGQYARLGPDTLGWGTLPRDLYHICRQRLVR